MRDLSATREARRFLGLELGGAKNEKTAIAALEFYPRERKVFLLDIFDRISGDATLLEILDELKVGVAKLGVNVPLTLPPCFECKRKSCTALKCSSPATRWMRNFVKKNVPGGSSKKIKARQITPYTLRPIELYVRYGVMKELSDAAAFEVDEALGSTKAPLTARINYLKRSLTHFELVEVWPKLSIATMAESLELSRRTVSTYRNLEEGAHARSEILERLGERCGVFIYERDLKKLSTSLSAFDALICAYTALLSDLELCHKVPPGFPKDTGWVEYPRQCSPAP